jgi:protein SCO1/2
MMGAAFLTWRLGAPSSVRSHDALQSNVGGPFKLVDQTGAPVDERLLRGKWSAVFFGYTYCPDVCPTTLATLGQATTALGERAARFQVVFITVDPERDTPRALATYLASPAFPKATIGLTGALDQVASVARAYHVYYQKQPQGSSYSMDHSAVVYLMDPRGRFVRPLDVGAPPREITSQIISAMDAG